MCPISPLQETPVQQVDLKGKGKGKVFPREVGHTPQTSTSVLIQLALHHRSFIFQFSCFVPATNFDKPSQMATLTQCPTSSSVHINRCHYPTNCIWPSNLPSSWPGISVITALALLPCTDSLISGQLNCCNYSLRMSSIIVSWVLTIIAKVETIWCVYVVWRKWF